MIRFYSVEVSQALVARLTRVRFTVGPILLPFVPQLHEEWQHVRRNGLTACVALQQAVWS
jgi:hypothetical protein